MDESKKHSRNRFKIGQLVRLQSLLSVGETIEMRVGIDDSQSVYLKEGTFALILDFDEIEDYKVFADGIIGWIDLYDISQL